MVADDKKSRVCRVGRIGRVPYATFEIVRQPPVIEEHLDRVALGRNCWAEFSSRSLVGCSEARLGRYWSNCMSLRAKQIKAGLTIVSCTPSTPP